MSDTTGTDFIGHGIAYPMRVDASGSIATVGGPASIESAMRVVLLTAPGERVMRPEFGCRIWDLLFEPVNANTIGLMDRAVREALGQWEPRCVVDDVTVTPDEREPALVRIGITYRVRATNDRRNLVFPFYVIPSEPAP